MAFHKRVVAPCGQGSTPLRHSKGGFSAQDPAKMDHIKAVIRFSDMVDDLGDVWIQMKLRKVLTA